MLPCRSHFASEEALYASEIPAAELSGIVAAAAVLKAQLTA
jgi:hypothetical protein